MQLALAGSSSSLHSEVCKALKRASACFTTNFLDREIAFARLPPLTYNFALQFLHPSSEDWLLFMILCDKKIT